MTDILYPDWVGKTRAYTKRTIEDSPKLLLPEMTLEVWALAMAGAPPFYDNAASEINPQEPA